MARRGSDPVADCESIPRTEQGILVRHGLRFHAAGQFWPGLPLQVLDRGNQNALARCRDQSRMDLAGCFLRETLDRRCGGEQVAAPRLSAARCGACGRSEMLSYKIVKWARHGGRKLEHVLQP